MQYSKLLPIFTGTLFGVVLVFSLFAGICSDTFNNYSIYVTAISCSGGCFGASVIWYMKKAQIENVFKIKQELYKTVSSEQLKYAKGVLELQNKHGVSAEEIKQLDYDSQLDEMKMSAIMDVESTIDNAMSDAQQPTEIQNY